MKFLMTLLLPILKNSIPPLHKSELIQDEIPSRIGGKMKTEMQTAGVWILFGVVLAGILIFSLIRLLLLAEAVAFADSESFLVPVLMYSLISLVGITLCVWLLYGFKVDKEIAKREREVEIMQQEENTFPSMADLGQQLWSGFRKGLEQGRNLPKTYESLPASAQEIPEPMDQKNIVTLWG